MIFLSGPRQVGKTFLARKILSEGYEATYLNWDDLGDREVILSGPSGIAAAMGLDTLSAKNKLLILDETHKFPGWKNHLKGFFDSHGEYCSIVVTGSARLDIFKKGGDSLMGRYFPYQLHPLSLREISGFPPNTNAETASPVAPDGETMERLLTFGGFPEPFLKMDKRFHTRWKNLRSKQLFNEEIRTIADLRNVSQLELMAELIRLNPGELTAYSSLAKKCGVSIETVKRWLLLLENLYYCFRVSPWSANVSRSLIKESKFYLYDWSLVEDEGRRIENMVASHLLKAIAFWEDSGMGNYALHFLRDKEKREVDFLIVRNRKPWILLEVKKSATKGMSKNLERFQRQIHAEHVFQVSHDMPFVDKDCFKAGKPAIVPMSTFLSQLP